MENKIKEILNKILSNENLLEISLRIDNINDLAGFFISQGVEKSSKEYLIKYFTDIYEDRVNILEIVPEDLLLKISGGANKKIARSISMVLSSLISLNCVSPNVFAEKNTKNSRNRVTKHADKILGAVGAVVVPLLIYKLFSNINSTNINYKLVTEEYLQDPKTPVSADMWFTNLGGTQTDIEGYQKLRTVYDLGVLPQDNRVSDVSTIRADVPRRSAWIRDFNDLNEETLIRILSIYYSQSENLGYVQGYDRALYMICYKFLSNNITYTHEIEAKIYYIYGRIIEIMRNFENTLTWQSKFDSYAKKFRKQTDVSTQQQLDMLYEKYGDGNKVDGKNAITPKIILTLGMEFLDIKEAINVWDNILTNPALTSKNTRKLDSDKVLDLINIVGHTKLLNEL
ncbi:MAG: hypothetical protein IJC57_04465 [Clostridia bacterium]|nr:hypothetical protein [Clostridia bacterium]